MKLLSHWAIFSSNEVNTQSFVQQILAGKAPAPFHSFNHQNGAFFSPMSLAQLIEEESRRDYILVTNDLKRPLGSLSSGEQKKALLAHILAQNPDYIILDNPYDNLDTHSQQSLKEMLTQVATHTTLLQIIYRKAELLPFIQEAVRLDNNNSVTRIDSIAEYMHQLAINHPPIIANKIPKPLHDYPLTNKQLVSFTDVTVEYENRPILKNIHWTINAGEFWQLIGPNGSGKTTLLTMITGDNVKGYGKDLVLFGKRKGSGETVWEIKEKIGYVTPAMTSLFSTRHTLEDMVISGFFDSIGLYVIPSELERRLANEWLSVMELSHLKDKVFCELSLSVQRKALIARAMVKHPPVLILDEPAFGLDDYHTAIVTGLINKIAAESNTAIIYVSHRAEKSLSPQFIFELTPSHEGSTGLVKHI